MTQSVLIVTDAWKPQVNGVVACLGAVTDELVRRGIRVQLLHPGPFPTVPMPTYPEVRLALAGAGRIASIIDSFAPGHIHISTEGPLGLQARRYCLRNGLNFTTSYHTNFAQYVDARVPFTQDWIVRYLRWFHRPSQGVLVPTPSIIAQLAALGYERLRLWPRGVDRTRFYPGAKTRFLDLPGPHMLCVSRVSVEKNLRAFLGLKLPGSKILVGDGPQLDELRRAYPDVTFLGRQVGQELAEIYRSADVFVFPSRTDTFGNVMLEALASGVPVAAFPVAGPIDVLTDSASGALDEDLGTAIRRALALSRAAAVEHASRYTWSACASIFQGNLVPVGSRVSAAARERSLGEVGEKASSP